MDQPARFSAGQKVRLGAEIAYLYGRARWALRSDDLPGALAVLRDRSLAGQSGLKLTECVRLGDVVGRLLGRLPFDNRCLVRSLVLTALLARRSTRADLVIGVRPAPTFLAHAWVEVGGHPVLPTGDGAYHRLTVV